MKAKSISRNWPITVIYFYFVKRCPFVNLCQTRNVLWLDKIKDRFHGGGHCEIETIEDTINVVQCSACIYFLLVNIPIQLVLDHLQFIYYIRGSRQKRDEENRAQLTNYERF